MENLYACSKPSKSGLNAGVILQLATIHIAPMRAAKTIDMPDSGILHVHGVEEDAAQA